LAALTKPEYAKTPVFGTVGGRSRPFIWSQSDFRAAGTVGGASQTSGEISVHASGLGCQWLFKGPDQQFSLIEKARLLILRPDIFLSHLFSVVPRLALQFCC
jgi:hypothetical protein